MPYFDSFVPELQHLLPERAVEKRAGLSGESSFWVLAATAPRRSDVGDHLRLRASLTLRNYYETLTSLALACPPVRRVVVAAGATVH